MQESDFPKSTEDTLRHNRDLLLTLSRTALAVQQAHTVEELFQTVGNEILTLGGHVTILTVQEDQKTLCVSYISYERGLTRFAEQFGGRTPSGYCFPVEPDSVFAQSISTRNSEFVYWSEASIASMLPADLRVLAGTIKSLFNFDEGILAPLRVDGGVFGFLVISGLLLEENDVPAVDIFAGQIAVGLKNVRLMQKLQEELDARRQVEESLRHNRNLLSALSRAAQSIQKVRTQEDIYQVVGGEIQTLGFEATILMLNGEQTHLSLNFTTLSNHLLKYAEKITGLTVEGYSWSISHESEYERIINAGRAEYIAWSSDMFSEALPRPLHPLSTQLMRMLRAEHGIIAPLHVDEGTLGLLIVFGAAKLGEVDLPAVDSFAGQLAVALQNARLTQQAEQELAERKLAEETIARNERYFKAFIENATDGILVVGLDGKIQYESPSVTRLLGYPPNALIGRNAFDIIASEDLPNVMEQFALGLSTPGSVQRCEYRLLNANGELRHFEIFSHYLMEDPVINGIIINGRDISERKQAEAALRESEERYRVLYNDNPSMYFTADAEGKIISVNKYGVFQLGYESGDLVGQPLLDVFHPDDRETVQKQIAICLENPGQMVQIESRKVRKDGTHLWVRESACTVMDPHGWAVVLLVCDDVTAQKQAEAALRESERAYRTLFENMPIGLYRTSMEGRILDANPALARMFGYPDRDSLLGVMAKKLYLDPGSNARFLGEIKENGVLAGFEAEFRRHDGTSFWAEDFVRIIPAEDGTPLYYEGSLIDTTERKQAETAIRQAERRFKALIENASDGIALVGNDGKIKYASPSALHLFGYKALNDMDETPLEFIHPDDMGAVLGAMMGLIEDPAYVPTLQYRYKHTDGSYRWVESTFSNQFAEPGVESIVINFKDVTDRKEMEDALHESEKYYRALIENAPDGMLVLNVDGKIRYESPAVGRTLGYGSNALIGTDAFAFMHPDDLPYTIEGFKKGLGSPGCIHRGEYRLKHHNGEWRYFEIISHFLMDDPSIAGIIINGRDITERKQVEAELLESKLRFQRLADNAPDIIFRFNIQPTMQLSYINPAVQWVTGYTQDECYADPNLMLNMIHPEDYGIMLGYMQSFALPKGPMFLRWIGKDGATRWMESRVVPILDSDGQLTAVEGITRDITERKLAEDALRESESKFHSIVSESADGIVLIDESGCVIEFNKAIEEITGYKGEAFLGKPVWDMQFQITPLNNRSAELLERTKEMFNKALESGQAQFLDKMLDVPFEREEGTIRFVQMRVFSVQTEKGWRLGSISRDVTENKQAEEALHKQLAIISSLYEMTAALGQTSKLDEVFSYALDSLQNTLAARRASILLYDPDGVMRFKSWRGLSDAYRNAVEGHTPWERNAKDPQPVLVPDVRVDPNFAQFLNAFETEGIGSMGFIPLVHQEKLLGKLVIYYDAPHDFNNEEVLLAQTIARYVSFAIGRKLAEDELRFANDSLKVAHIELKEMFEHEQNLARTDVLTGQCNRRYFFELAMREFEASIRYGRPLTIILFDVDDFKQANDSFGHAVGDEILKRIAMIAASYIRNVDVLARYGGDEFIILLPETTSEQAFLIAERIRMAVASTPIQAEGQSVVVTNSIGVAEISSSSEDRSIEDIIRRADQALYKAKELGRNHTFIYNGEG